MNATIRNLTTFTVELQEAPSDPFVTPENYRTATDLDDVMGQLIELLREYGGDVEDIRVAYRDHATQQDVCVTATVINRLRTEAEADMLDRRDAGESSARPFWLPDWINADVQMAAWEIADQRGCDRFHARREEGL